MVPFVDASFNELVSSSILSPHSHVILHLGLARSCRIYISKSKGTPFKELDSFSKLSTNPQ